jgi:hypothetical protein
MKWKTSSAAQYSLIAPGLVMQDDGNTPVVPIRYSKTPGTALFAFNLRSTDDYTNMIKDTRMYVDDDSTHSWMSGIPFDYWEQYLNIFEVMVTVGGLSILVGFAISFIFIFTELSTGKRGTCLRRLLASGFGALLIAVVSAASLFTVVGLCSLAKIQLSGFTAMSCVMSIGLVVEYAVHVIHRFLEAPQETAVGRMQHAMEWLFSPIAMAFLTSAVSILMMAFSKFQFVRLYFFAPLAFAVLITYFFGSFSLPCLLGCFECLPALSLGAKDNDAAKEVDAAKGNDVEDPKTPLSPSAGVASLPKEDSTVI